jgi:hypothetical protein
MSAQTIYTNLINNNQIFGHLNIEQTDGYYLEQCASNQQVSSFLGRYGDNMDTIGIVCTDGTTVGPTGSDGGSTDWQTQQCYSGINTIGIGSGQYMYNLTPTCNGVQQPQSGAPNQSTNQTFTCPNGQVITGIVGRLSSQMYPDNIGFICNPPASLTSSQKVQCCLGNAPASVQPICRNYGLLPQSGSCDSTMRTICGDANNPALNAPTPACNCILSTVTQPQCFDPTCTAGGAYVPSTMDTNCADICQQIIQTGGAESINVSENVFDQTCGTTNTGNTGSIGTTGSTGSTGSSFSNFFSLLFSGNVQEIINNPTYSIGSISSIGSSSSSILSCICFVFCIGILLFILYLTMNR